MIRRVEAGETGIRRVRHGRGFRYLDPAGTPVSDVHKRRAIALVIPPAWEEVWICADDCGHVQATGIDGAGRKQYLYHPGHRARMEAAKFDHVLDFAEALPSMRERVEEGLAEETLSREQSLALAVRLLDRGFFRIGSEQYAESNDTYGLATLLRSHVRVSGDEIRFDYPAKHGVRATGRLIDPLAAPLVGRLRRHRRPELLAYKHAGRWQDVTSPMINEYIKTLTVADASAKDFRTWKATVIASVSMAAAVRPETDAGIVKLEAHAAKQAANYLGNTPAVCRSSYIDPRVFEAYRAGEAIELSDAIGVDPALEVHEPAVIRLLR